MLVGCFTHQHYASVSQGWICSDKCKRCHTEIEAADQISISPSHSILTPIRPVSAPTIYRQASGTVIIIIIIAFKGTIRDFLQSPHSAANCLQHVRSSGPGATVCKSRATHRALITCKCRVTCHLVRRDSSAIKF